MIYKNSRYYDGSLSQVLRKDKYSIAVDREFPPERTLTFFEYTWTESDFLDSLAQVYFGSPLLWWVILDANPQIHDAMNIAPGTRIRIPRD